MINGATYNSHLTTDYLRCLRSGSASRNGGVSDDCKPQGILTEAFVVSVFKH